MMKLGVLGILLAVIVEVKNGPSSAAMPQFEEYFCKDNEYIKATFFPSLYEGYTVHINKEIPALTEIRLRFDSSAGISFIHENLRIISELDPIDNVIKFIVLRDLQDAWFKVDGKRYPYHPPYVTSIKINGIEKCLEPNQTYFEQVSHRVHKFFDAPDKTCGRRRLNGQYTELIVSGSETNYGDWPWHAAIYRLDKSSFSYICGGTLISKFFILTAAHCVTIRGQPVVPDILGVVLGKYSLIGNNKASIEKKVFKVIPYDEYDHKTHNKDIALMKLRTQAVFNNFVQPACLWFDGIEDHMGIHEFTGSVVGWGFDQSDSLTSELHQGQMPQVPDLTCIKFQPVFYSAMLDGTKFCAGYSNGTSACNGDSGGGFVVFVNDVKPSSTDLKDVPGAWYVRGIVSTTLARPDAAICNPNAYAVFTDVSKYTDWIQNTLSEWRTSTVSIRQIVLIGSAITSEHPCNGTNEIHVIYESNQPPEKENSYEVHVYVIFPKYSLYVYIVTVMLDSGGSITLSKKSFARIFASDNNSFRIHFFKAHDGLSFKVKGNRIGTVPYIISLEINSQEYCSKPFLGFLDTGYKDYAESYNKKLEGNCGRRKITHTELIVNGASTKTGDWAWHTAIYRTNKSLIKYICGGTLISKHFVLKAAHCTSERGVPLLPEVLSVVLGKFNLFGGDTGSQEREIHQIIVHNNFENRLLNNDIALLQLKTEALFSDYIQTACFWYTKATETLSTEGIIGTVVGWGFDNTDTLAHQLQQASMPLITEVVCIKSNPVFYSKVLNENKFCAGYHNGTSACNGDSCGAFQVFIPDNAQDKSHNAEGAWYVRGIVSLTLSRTDVPICDPTQYVVFTDVEKYRSWIENHAGLI